MKKDTCPLMFTDSSPAIFSGSNAEATRCNFKLHASTYVQQSVSGSAPSDAVADARQQWHVAVRVSDEDDVQKVRLDMPKPLRPRSVIVVSLDAIQRALYKQSSRLPARNADLVHRPPTVDCRNHSRRYIETVGKQACWEFAAEIIPGRSLACARVLRLGSEKASRKPRKKATWEVCGLEILIRRRFAIMMRVLVGPCCYCRRAKLRTHGHRAVAH